MNNLTTIQKLMLLLLVWYWLSGGGSLVPGGRAAAAVYVHEKDGGSTPPPVQAAIDELNVPPFSATIHEVDGKNPNQQVPEQYKFAVPAAKADGLPSFVWMGTGGKVVKLVKNPQTYEQVMESKP